MYKGMHVFLLALLVSLTTVGLAAAQQDRLTEVERDADYVQAVRSAKGRPQTAAN